MLLFSGINLCSLIGEFLRFILHPFFESSLLIHPQFLRIVAIPGQPSRLGHQVTMSRDATTTRSRCPRSSSSAHAAG